jgi:protein ImuA
MALASPQTPIAELRRWLERTEGRSRTAGTVLPFGVAELDARLPAGGLRLSHIHEVVKAGTAAHYAGLAALFVAGVAARMRGPVLWCLKGRDLFAPALARVGLHPDRVIYCETWKDRDVLPAMEEGLRCNGLAAVVGEVTRLSLNASRRLQLCAEETGVTALAIHRWRNVAENDFTTEPNAADTRWRVSPHPSGNDREDMGRQQWRVELLRARGGEAQSWIMGACGAKGFRSPRRSGS